MPQNVLVIHPDINVHWQYQNNMDVNYFFNPKKVDEIAKKTRIEFSDYIDNISENAKSDIDWWVILPVSRNTLHSKVFLDVCYLKYSLEEISVNDIDLVVCYSDILKNSLIELLTKLGKNNVIVESLQNLRYKGYEKIKRVVLSIMYFLYHSLKRKSCSIFTKGISIHRLLNEKIILLDNFMINNSLVDGKFKDRYYPKLVDLLPNYNWVYFPHFYGITKYYNIFKQIRKSASKFLIKDDFLHISDYLWALFFPFRFIKYKGNFTEFSGIDISCLMVEEIWNSLIYSYEALLNFRVFKRLKENNIQIIFAVDWFENQIIDKSLNLGIRRYYPRVHTIGYQSLFAPDYYLCIKPSRYERIAGVIPKTIAVTGKKISETIKEFDSELSVIVAPAFRFNHVWNSKSSSYSNQQNKFFKLVIGLPLMLDESYQILSLFKEIKDKIPSTIFICVKVHPATPYEKILEFIETNRLERLSISDTPMNELLNETNLLISNNSSILVEAIASGIPVICVGSQTGLTLNPIPPGIPGKIWRLCFTPDEIFDTIISFSKYGVEDYAQLEKIGENVKEDYFEPVNEQTVLAFSDFIQQNV
jgi:hypothetical protein